MSIEFDPDQIRLLELFVSPGYLGDLRDKWAQMIDHVESCLTLYMSNLDARYRSKPLPEQPDIVWGHRVLPNFRDTLENLNQGFIVLTHGDLSGLGSAHGPRSDSKGQMEFWAGWMSKDDEKLYDKLLYSAVQIANNIVLTEGAYWDWLDPSKHSSDLQRSLSNHRSSRYRANMNVSIYSGETIKVSGIYVPDIYRACPQFLIAKRHTAPLAKVHVDSKDIFDPITGEKYDEEKIFEKRECTWYLVERSDNDDTDAQESGLTEIRSVSGSEKCPETGYYFSPARINSRARFERGDIMPSFDSSYGKTVWQWDTNQN